MRTTKTASALLSLPGILVPSVPIDVSIEPIGDWSFSSTEKLRADGVLQLYWGRIRVSVDVVVLRSMEPGDIGAMLLTGCERLPKIVTGEFSASTWPDHMRVQVFPSELASNPWLDSPVDWWYGIGGCSLLLRNLLCAWGMLVAELVELAVPHPDSQKQDDVLQIIDAWNRLAVTIQEVSEW
jgi:hypothetical protein